MSEMANRITLHAPQGRQLDFAARLLIAGLAGGLLAFTTGCSDPPPPPPPVQEEVVQAEPEPQPTTTDLFALHNIDPRITIAQDEVPMDDMNPELATEKLVAVLKFFDAMVRGSDERMRPMLASADQTVLAELVQGGLFQSAAKGVTRVILGCGSFQLGFDTNDAVFALVQSGSSFEAQLWTYKLGENGTAVFDAAPTPPDILNRLTGTKAAPRIRQWADAMKARLEEAKKPDELIEIPTVNYGVEGEEGTEGGSAPSGSPTGPTPANPDEPGKRPQGPGGIPAPRPPGVS